MPQQISLSTIKELLQKIAAENDIPQQVEDTWKHSECVWKFAEKIARLAIQNGYRVDLEFLKLGCFIHDLGRTQTGSKATHELIEPVLHGYLGYKIALKNKLPRKLAEICRRHIGGTGLAGSENRKYKIGFFGTHPRTIEEKIISYSDCRTFRYEIEFFQKAYNRFCHFPGAAKRLKRLQEFISKITNNQIS